MGIISSKNIKFIAYLRLNDIHPDKVEKVARGRATYYFELEESFWKKNQADFNKSQYIKYAQCIDAVMDLSY